MNGPVACPSPGTGVRRLPTSPDVARRHSGDPVVVQATVAAADGICARVLLDEEPITAPEVRAVLRSALRLD